ncbi:MAG: Hsp20/alpha crystallin family protein [Nevskia sp.]|nr:Hsp20/alpha crystallin family protein [Nevskia sp.]
MADTSSKVPVKTEDKGKEARVAKAEPWHPFENLRREIDRVFDDFGRGFGWSLSRWPFGRSIFDLEPAWRQEFSFGPAPAVDIVEHEKEYEIEAEIPGLDEKNLEVTLANGVLTIKGEKKEETEEKRKNYYLSERRYGSFQRCFQVPDGVDSDKIEATFSKGVLKVKLPKTPEAQKKEKKISVKVA